MVIDGYSIGGYWCLFSVNILLVIGGYVISGYSIGGYWCLLMIIILLVIGGYFVVSH
jgi:hypothetical protein